LTVHALDALDYVYLGLDDEIKYDFVLFIGPDVLDPITGNVIHRYGKHVAMHAHYNFADQSLPAHSDERAYSVTLPHVKQSPEIEILPWEIGHLR
jgi:hypothetical protein